MCLLLDKYDIFVTFILCDEQQGRDAFLEVGKVTVVLGPEERGEFQQTQTGKELCQGRKSGQCAGMDSGCS